MEKAYFSSHLLKEENAAELRELLRVELRLLRLALDLELAVGARYFVGVADLLLSGGKVKR